MARIVSHHRPKVMTPSQLLVRLPIVTCLQFLYGAGRNAGYDCYGRGILRHDRALAEGVGLAERSEPAGSQEPERP